MSISYDCEYDISMNKNPQGTILYYTYTSTDDPYLTEGEKQLYLYVLKPNYKIDVSITTNTGEEYPCNLIFLNTTDYDYTQNIVLLDSSNNVGSDYTNITDLLTELNSLTNLNISANETPQYIEFTGGNLKVKYMYHVGALDISINNYRLLFQGEYNKYMYNNILTVNTTQSFQPNLSPDSYRVDNSYKTIDNGTVNIHYENTTDRAIPIALLYTNPNENINKIYVSRTITPLLQINYDTNSFTVPVGYSFNTTPAIMGSGDLTITYTGNLPNGLTLNSNTGVISGIPTTIGNYSITVTISNNSFTSQSTITFTIVNNTFVYENNIKVSEDMTISPQQIPTAYNNGTITYTTQLVTGITFNSNTCVININKEEISDENNIIITVNEIFENTTLSYSQNIFIYLKKFFQYSREKFILPSTNFTSILIQPIVEETSYSVTGSGLPNGLTLSNNGNIYNSGSELTIGEYEVNIHFTSGNNVVDYILLLEIVDYKSLLNYEINKIYNINTDIAITPILNLEGYTLNFSSDNILNYFTLNNQTGVITGNINRINRFNITVNCSAQDQYNTINLYDNLIINVGTFYRLYSLINKFKYKINNN